MESRSNLPYGAAPVHRGFLKRRHSFASRLPSFEVGDQLRIQVRDIPYDTPRTQGLGRPAPRRDGHPRGHRRGVRAPSLPYEAQELVDDQRVRPAVPGAVRHLRDHMGGVGLLAVEGAAGIPHLHHRARPVPEVLEAAHVTDDRVVAPVVRGEMALLVGGQHPVVQAHVDQG
ncbi:hypothetical protein J7E95_39035, partial [Streptomyces sp. ISL-14]|nr:hypothetical protein [Streptomyces sp. ISL-14]